MRKLASLILLAAVAPGTLLRESLPAPSHVPDLRFVPIALPDQPTLAKHLGQFRLEAIWEMRSSHSRFGSYSALVSYGRGQLMAVSDRGDTLRFSVPGRVVRRPVFGSAAYRRGISKSVLDAESATRDPATGQVWIGWEHLNAISRHDANLKLLTMAWPPAMRKWPANSGAEAMVRLPGGRFVVLSEGFSPRFQRERHSGLIFGRDPSRWEPPWRFTFAGPENFSPTDMAQMPDGRVLVLMRRLVWPFPMRFAGRIALADPARLRRDGVWRAREVARLTSSLPVDNFEGIAIDQRPDRRIDVWLISDDNNAVTQRTLLWHLIVDPARLP